jgi:hypothetical protein
MKVKNLKEKLLYLAAIGLGMFLLFFVITTSMIGFSVKDHCQEAQGQYGGDCVEALISLLNDENQDFGDRNSAIWALGQLGDKRALPVLESYYTGNIPDREPWHKTLSQYELEKAINLTSGGLNISAFVWRGF